MSLQVWLPLNGNLNNQGLLDSPSKVILQSGNSFSENGKIGQCLSSTTTNVAYFQDTSNNKLISLFNSGHIYSMAFWYKLTGNGTNGSIIQIGTTTPSSGSGNGVFGFWWTKDNGGTNPRLVWNDGDNGKRILNKSNDNSDIATDYTNWHHLVAIIDKTNMAAQRQIFYIDGVKVRDQVYDNSNANALTITNANNYIYLRPYYALLNDIRIYDHALSTKEIDELSKGLILHYKLDDKQLVNQNLFSLDKVIVSSSKVTCQKNGSTLILTSQSINYGGFITASANYLTFTAGVTYTLSGHIKVITRGTDNYSPILCIRNSSNNIQVSKTVSGDESNVVMTWTPSSTITGYVSGINTWNNGNNNTTNAITEFSNIKLEIGSNQTPWVPNINDSLYSILGYNIIKIKDSSGYQNDGEIVGILNSTNNSSRYNNSIYIDNGVTNYIISQSPLRLPGDQITMAYWFKSSNKSPIGDYHIPFNSYNDSYAYEMSIHKSGYLKGGLLINGTRYIDNCTSTNLTDGNWHHCVMTYDGTIIKRYVDGVMEKSTSITGTLNTSQQFIFGHYGTNTGYACKEAYISDARLYTTALTEEQVLDLYHTSVTIDNLGNIYSREYDEDDNLSITKTGELKCNIIYDSDELTKASILMTNKQVQGNTLYEY